RLIERSGMATIFKGVDCQTGQMVAVKVPHGDFAVHRASSSRFARETAILRHLNHPGIVKIIPVAERTRPYAVIEYLQGETLSEILGRTPQLPVCQALQLASRICRILDYMHRHGVIHLDLKPGNIMISDDGSPHIIDIGIAKPSKFGLFSPAIGTPEYMSP